MGIELAAEDVQDQSVTLTPAQPQEASQPAFQPDPVKLDEAQVRAAMKQAAASGTDPFSLAVGDLNQGEAPKERVEPPQEMPDKFKKPNGEADVEKLKASTRQLDEAIQQKEVKLKTVEEMFQEYKVKETQFRSMPNPDKLAAQIPPGPVQPLTPAQVPMEAMKARILQDLNADPVGTITDLIAVISKQQLQPIEEERRDNAIRQNIRALAEKDQRILNPQVFAAVNAKLASDPDLWKLKNPHKAAWLEVKEDLRLGELTQAQAHPSKPSAPILGGGTPPPAPSSSETTQDVIFGAAAQLGKDPRDRKYDPKQQAAVDQAAKRFFDDLERRARRF